MAIMQPLNTAILKWNSRFAAERNAHIARMQRFVDSEVLRLNDPLTPKKTGNLINSAKTGTKIGSGEIQYIAPYARYQYYNTSESRSYDPNRGARWFERMKTAHANEILEGAMKVE